jgi:hypothetical protein
MAKLKLSPDPTFTAAVGIPVHGTDPAQVSFTFKHRDRPGVQAWMEEVANKTDAEVVSSCVTGWELEDEFTPENVKRLCDNYGGAGMAIFSAYLDELRGARAKN